ncbi:hypothetical protein Tco_0154681 [Tanacetum coccineum]
MKGGDNDANDGDDDEREISWFYETRDGLDKRLVEEEDGEQIRFLGGNSSSGTKKYRGSNSNDGGNIGDGVKIAGEVIGSSDEIALSVARSDLLPSPKRIRSPKSTTDLEGCSKDSFEPYVPRETGLGVDFVDEKIGECFAYADAFRDREIDARVVVEAIDREEIEMGVRGLVEDRVDRVTHPVVADDIHKPAQEGCCRGYAIESIQRDQGHKIVVTGQQSADMVERILELERDNRRLRDIMDVESQRVT